jgi:hypothetical protein
VYLTGWGSKVENLLQLSKNTFRLASFSARERVLRITDTSENPQMISLLWLYTRTNKYHQIRKKWFGFKGMKMDFSWMSKIGDFLKQLF